MGTGGDLVTFDEFELDTARFELRRQGRPVPLERQVFDLLAYLVAARGRVVTKEELLDNVWGTRFVTESALTTQIKFARRALGDSGSRQRYIRTVHRRGYEFVAEASDRPTTSPAAGSPEGRAPRSGQELIGREAVLADVSELVRRGHLVTIVGPGGVGKTRVAMAVADDLSPSFGDGVVVVDLAVISDPDDVVRLVAEAGGLGLREGAAVADALAGLDALVVLDNCEHVLAGVAALVERLLARPADPVRVLATSREPLAVQGEEVVELAPLRTTDAVGGPSPAARLFLERAGRRTEGADPDEVEALVALLDGLPLAIELAAAQLGVLTVGELHERLRAHRLRLTADRRRPDREDSLAASVAWSWELLGDEERRMLTELSILPGSWNLDTAEGLSAVPEPVATLRRLHDRSLVASTRSGGTTRFHLLFGVRDFVRTFPAELPGGSGALRRRLAGWLADWLDEWTFEEQWVSAEFVDVLVAERATIGEATRSVEDGDLDAAARIVAASAASYRYGIGVGAGRRRIETIDRTALAPGVRARVALAGSEAAYAVGDVDRTADLAAEALAFAELDGRGDLAAVARVQQCVGRMLQDPERCSALLERAATDAGAAGTERLEATVLALSGFCALGAGADPEAVLATAADAERLAAPSGWDRTCLATLEGAAHLLAGSRGAAAEAFAGIASGAALADLPSAAALYRLLSVTCVADELDPLTVAGAIDDFRRWFHRATGHAGRADALLLLAHRAVRRGETARARELADAVRGRRLAHQAGLLVLREVARLAGAPPVDLAQPSVAVPQSDPVLAELLDRELERLRSE